MARMAANMPQPPSAFVFVLGNSPGSAKNMSNAPPVPPMTFTPSADPLPIKRKLPSLEKSQSSKVLLLQPDGTMVEACVAMLPAVRKPGKRYSLFLHGRWGGGGG